MSTYTKTHGFNLNAYSPMKSADHSSRYKFEFYCSAFLYGPTFLSLFGRWKWDSKPHFKEPWPWCFDIPNNAYIPEAYFGHEFLPQCIEIWNRINTNSVVPLLLIGAVRQSLVRGLVCASIFNILSPFDLFFKKALIRQNIRWQRSRRSLTFK